MTRHKHCDGDSSATGSASHRASPSQRGLKGFSSLGLDGKTVVRALLRRGYTFPTPIQRRMIPVVLSGRDVVAMARTGSGKTAAFLCPLIQRVASGGTERVGVRALILSPTRELAVQTFGFLHDYSRYVIVRAGLVVGGESLEAQFALLAGNPEVLVATPGRLRQLLQQVPGFGLHAVEVAVFDEADRLWEGSLRRDTLAIVEALDARAAGGDGSAACQKVLVSATMPAALAEFSRAALREPQLVRLDVERLLSPAVTLEFFVCRADEKPAALSFLLRQVLPQSHRVVVFVATRHHAEYLAMLLPKHLQRSCAMVHGHMDQAARNGAVQAFRRQTVPLLLVTDVAARGIDFPFLEAVVNYDFPSTPKLFVHRCGRVGRAGRAGVCLSLAASADELAAMADVYLFLGHALTAAKREATAPPYGRLPEALLAAEVETVRNAHHIDTDLDNQYRTAMRASGLVQRTRPAPSAASVARVKTLFGGVSRVPLHPRFEGDEPVPQVDGADAASSLTAAHLIQWRPPDTVVPRLPNARIAATERRSEIAADTAPQLPAELDTRDDLPEENSCDVMERHACAPLPSVETRDAPAPLPCSSPNDVAAPVARRAAKRQRREACLAEQRQHSLPSCQEQSRATARWREEVLGVERVHDAVLDLQPDDPTGRALAESATDGDAVAPTARLRTQWDQRKKKYVRVDARLGNVNDPRVRRALRKAPRASTADDATRYLQWARKTRARVQRVGEEADPAVAALALGTVRRPDYRRGGRRPHNRQPPPPPLGMGIDTDRLRTHAAAAEAASGRHSDGGQLRPPSQIRKQRERLAARREALRRRRPRRKTGAR